VKNTPPSDFVDRWPEIEVAQDGQKNVLSKTSLLKTLYKNQNKQVI
jgi:hypothetical protein